MQVIVITAHMTWRKGLFQDFAQEGAIAWSQILREGQMQILEGGPHITTIPWKKLPLGCSFAWLATHSQTIVSAPWSGLLRRLPIQLLNRGIEVCTAVIRKTVTQWSFGLKTKKGLGWETPRAGTNTVLSVCTVAKFGCVCVEWDGGLILSTMINKSQQGLSPVMLQENIVPCTMHYLVYRPSQGAWKRNGYWDTSLPTFLSLQLADAAKYKEYHWYCLLQELSRCYVITVSTILADYVRC